jgi:hypothetical protein
MRNAFSTVNEIYVAYCYFLFKLQIGFYPVAVILQ